MVFLFPRLLPSAAKTLREAYLGKSAEELRSSADLSHTAMFYAATGGVRLPVGRLRDIRAEILRAAEERGFPASHNRKQAATFDITVAEMLHRDSGIIPAEAVAGDLWAFLSLVLMPDVAAWRYSDLHRDRVLGSDVTRHVFGRLWWRAHLVHDSEAEEETSTPLCTSSANRPSIRSMPAARPSAAALHWSAAFSESGRGSRCLETR